ncbi:Anticodon binding domain-containing protein [Candidatus Kryptobacter tengchongensis]|nr:Anticodon binding domain-containing protein [Candidatus Kryptobacter tengchongensis]
MEMQYFVRPGTDMEWFERWREERFKWYLRIGIKPEKLRFHQHGPDELAHYATAAYDIQFEFPFGWQELEGIHNRTNYDLSRHQQFSGKDLSYYDDEIGQKYIPYIIETSAGCDRTLLAVLVNAYDEEDTGKEIRTVLRLHPFLAPIKAAVLPLVNRENMPEIAFEIYKSLKPHFKVFYDDSGSIGRRYRRQDEIGTPFCFTVDSQTLQDGTVTVRDRDTMKQERIHKSEVLDFLKEKITFYQGAGILLAILAVFLISLER